MAEFDGPDGEEQPRRPDSSRNAPPSRLDAWDGTDWQSSRSGPRPGYEAYYGGAPFLRMGETGRPSSFRGFGYDGDPRLIPPADRDRTRNDGRFRNSASQDSDCWMVRDDAEGEWSGIPMRMAQKETPSFRQSGAAELMTENPEAVTGDTPIRRVAARMKDLDVGIIPVIDGEESRRLRGIITDRDIAIRAVAEGKGSDTPVVEFMTQRVRSVNTSDSIREVMRVMGEEQIRRVPVTDREGRLVGIIAQADLAVDFAHDDHGRELAVADTIERISSPAMPERSHWPTSD